MIIFIMILLKEFLFRSSPIKQKKTKVLILGAGLAGIKAAKTLLDRDITDILILEGKNYTGGRIHAIEFANYPIETGANWIHFVNDTETKPIVDRGRAKKMKGLTSNYSDILIR